LKQWRTKLQFRLLKWASESSVPVLPVALIRKGRNPAAVKISSGIAEQR